VPKHAYDQIRIEPNRLEADATFIASDHGTGNVKASEAADGAAVVACGDVSEVLELVDEALDAICAGLRLRASETQATTRSRAKKAAARLAAAYSQFMRKSSTSYSSLSPPEVQGERRWEVREARLAADRH
jgi:hypothetical protein